MVILLWIVVIIIIGLSAIVWLFFWALSGMESFNLPTKEIDSINHIKNFFGFDFGEDYEIVYYDSRNYHPDQPLEVILLFTETTLIKVQAFITEIDTNIKETLSEDKETKYVETFFKESNSFSKYYSASHINSGPSGYEFFNANLTINYREKTLSYNETGF